MRYAVVKFATPAVVAQYLPGNYVVVGYINDSDVLIRGEDEAGWTLDGYVIPRLASGLYSCEEVSINNYGL